MDNLPSFIANNFDGTEQREIVDAIKRTNGSVFVRINMDHVYCSVGNETIVDRETFYAMINRYYQLYDYY